MKKILPAIIVLFLLFQHVRLNAQSGRPVLNHIALYVKDLKKSTSFYMNIVQLDTIPEPFHDGKHTWFSVSDVSHLHLIEGAREIGVHDKNAHLCFSVPSMKEVISRLKKNNIPYEGWLGQPNEVALRVDGISQIYFTDPDGYWVEINDDYPKNRK